MEQNTVGDVGTFNGDGKTRTGTVVFVGKVENVEGLSIAVRTPEGKIYVMRNDGTLFKKSGVSPAAGGRRRFKTHRLMSRKYCKKTPCRRMGFTQKASCRPYKNCYRK